jgi:uncharacterized membrane protein
LLHGSWRANMSIIELLLVFVCGGGLLLLLAVGAWVLINKSKLEESGSSQQEQLDALDREYAEGDLDEDEYERRRARILNQSDRMR